MLAEDALEKGIGSWLILTRDGGVATTVKVRDVGIFRSFSIVFGSLGLVLVLAHLGRIQWEVIRCMLGQGRSLRMSSRHHSWPMGSDRRDVAEFRYVERSLLQGASLFFLTPRFLTNFVL